LGEEPVVSAPEDRIEEALPLEPVEDSFAPPPVVEVARPGDVRRRPGSSWGFTDFAVVLLALGVVSLSAVGYFALLR
jgi:hypothetical protein